MILTIQNVKITIDEDGNLIEYKLTTYSGPDVRKGTVVWYDKDHNEITD